MIEVELEKCLKKTGILVKPNRAHGTVPYSRPANYFIFRTDNDTARTGMKLRILASSSIGRYNT